MKLTARNQFPGRVLAVTTGPIMAKVKVEIGGGLVVTALITSESASEIGVAKGKAVSVIVKSTDVMLASE